MRPLIDRASAAGSVAGKEPELTHRTFTINSVLFNVFESHAGAQRFMSQQEGDYSVVVRGRTFSARRGDTYLTVNLTSTAKPEHGHIMEAANAVAAEIDKMIAAEEAAA
jgi:hypothetical protein